MLTSMLRLFSSMVGTSIYFTVHGAAANATHENAAQFNRGGNARSAAMGSQKSICLNIISLNLLKR